MKFRVRQAEVQESLATLGRVILMTLLCYAFKAHIILASGTLISWLHV